jgi:hypothetical protein
MTFKGLMQQLKAAKNPLECITVELDAMAAARKGSITTQERDELVTEIGLMRRHLKDADGIRS